MKSFAVLVVLVVLGCVHQVVANGGLIKLFAGTCKTAEKASDKDVDDMSKGVVPETPEGKCLAGDLQNSSK